MDNVVSILGKEFVRYVLAVDDDNDMPDEANLTNNQRQVLAQLRIFLSQLQISLGESSGLALYNVLSKFGVIFPGTQRSVANLLRVQAGGTLEETPDTEDSFARHMFTLAIESYPIYLLPRPKQGPPAFWTSATLTTHQHPSGLEAVRELLRDGSLRLLFPDAPNAEAINSFGDAVDIHAWWTLNSGRGGSFQAVILVDIILNYSYGRLTTSGLPATPAHYIEAVQHAIDDVRALARGEVVKVPQVAGLYNVQLDNDVVVPVADGVFRVPTSSEREKIYPDGGNVQVVLDTKYPLRMIEIRPWIPDEDPARVFSDEHMRDFEQTQRDSRRRIDRARLALLLASEPGSLISPVEIANIVLDPLTPGGSASWRTEIVAPVPTVTVTAQAAARATSWADTIHKRQAHNLDIGIRRLLSAVTARLDPIDGFVDAVVCWENLFGTQTETTFRVTAAMAWLLEPDDATKRDTLQTELKRLYDTRSQLVHGSREPQPAEAAKLRDRAAELAAESLRRIYQLPELLTLKSDTRSRRILLGALIKQ